MVLGIIPRYLLFHPSPHPTTIHCLWWASYFLSLSLNFFNEMKDLDQAPATHFSNLTVCQNNLGCWVTMQISGLHSLGLAWCPGTCISVKAQEAAS